MSHHWEENSGTTMRCSKCGAIRLSLDERGSYTPNARAAKYKYSKRIGTRPSKAPPECIRTLSVSANDIVEAVERAHKLEKGWAS